MRALPAGTLNFSHVVVAGGLIYVVTNQSLQTHDVATGQPVSSTAVPFSSIMPQPIVSEGHVYLVSGTSIDAYAPAS